MPPSLSGDVVSPVRRPVPMSRLEEALRFSGRALGELPLVRSYGTEVFRQAGTIIMSSALVLWFMEFMLGVVLGTLGDNVFRQFGAQSYVATVPAVFCTRGAVETMWGWILAAKVGCGFVAELGSMRISEEIDAMEVMGIRSRSYLVGTRLTAMIIAVPFLFIVGYLMTLAGSYLINVYVLRTVSDGGFFSVLWNFQNTTDFTFSVVWALVVSLVVVLVACFFGFTAKGGPVGVGLATASSMMVNMVLISVVAMVMEQLLYGNNPNAPIAN